MPESRCEGGRERIDFLLWALVGKTALENPDLPVDFVRELLISKHTDRALTEPFDLEPAKKAASKTRAPHRHG